MAYAELLEFNQPNPIRRPGFTRIRDSFAGLNHVRSIEFDPKGRPGNPVSVYSDPERVMEFAGRWDYGLNNARKLGEMSKMGDSEVPIVQKYLSMGHESMIEMGNATFFLEMSRVPSHELVRHRLASYQQESQRFVKYDTENIDELMVVPEGLDFYAVHKMRQVFGVALDAYKDLRNHGVSPQIARYVLPNATRTRIIMNSNIREWRHILKLRMDKSAQPEMQEVMGMVYEQLMDVFPNSLVGLNEGGRGVR